MKKIFDLLLSLCFIIVLSVPIFIIAVLVRLTSRGPALYWSDRVGVGNGIFKMPKFRTMRIDTPAVATHLLKDVMANLFCHQGLSEMSRDLQG
jgi:O-antigen biosynthesis protein WbqP